MVITLLMSIISIVICTIALVIELWIYLVSRINNGKTQGTIKGFTTYDRTNGYFYAPTVEYTVDGTVYTVIGKQTRRQNNHIGETVTVMYDKTINSNAKIGDNGMTWIVCTLIALGVSILSLIFSGAMSISALLYMCISVFGELWRGFMELINVTA